MIQMPIDILHQFPVRKSKKQKEQFRDAVLGYAARQGYPAAVERGSFGCRNVVIGDPDCASYLVTAHYDTPAWLPFSNFQMPCNLMVFLVQKIGLWIAIILFAAITGAVFGVFLGKWAVAPVSLAVFFGMIWLMMAGPANRSNANDNTSGVVTLLEILRTMPENQRHKVCFVLFDLEECGLIGAASYRKAHRKASDSQIVLNLDCVGDGDHLLMFPTRAMKNNRKKLTSLYKACGYFGKKSLLVHEKGFGFYPSDQLVFPYGVGICALNNNKHGLFVGKIHTEKDTVLEETNVNILRAALTTFISCDAVNLERK